MPGGSSQNPACSERPNFEPLDLCELICFRVETKKSVTSEKAGGNDVEDVACPEAMLCRVPRRYFSKEGRQSRYIDGRTAQEDFRC